MKKTSATKPAGQRFDNWYRKYDAERVKQLIEEGKAGMAEHAKAKFISLQDNELAVKAVLNSEGVSVGDVANYLCFGREMWKAAQKHAGATLYQEARVKVDKWEARGLDREVLLKISYSPFNVPASMLS